MYSFAAIPCLAAILLALVSRSLQQDSYTGPCRRWLHQTCIIDDKLYTDGGLVYNGDSFTNQTEETNPYLVWEDLSTIPPDSAPNAGFPVQNGTLKDSNVPTVTGGVLWPDNANKLFYLYGGAFYDSAPASFQLWLYDAIYNTWNETQPGDGQDTIIRTTRGAGAVDARGIAYYYGGYVNNQTSSGWTGGETMRSELVTYNMAANSWSQTTPTGNTPRAEGVMLYLPVSDSGMLVYFGGVQRAANGSTEFAPLNQIQLYDVKSSNWYTQTASGAVPPLRRGFCAGATWADDYSSYNIYIYGGFDENGNGLNDAWILSMPSFEWIELYVDSTYPSSSGHGWTTCNVYSRSQMIVMGGYFPDLTRTTCDVPDLGNQHGMSLGQQNVANATWYTFLPNVTTYDVPGNITSVIGGGSDGGATLRTPSAGWGNQDLAVYFTRSYTATMTPTRYPPSTTATSSSAPSSGGSSTNAGAIAGGVVGGVVGLALILGLVLCCLRRRKKHQTQANNPNGQQPDKNHSYVSSEMQHPSPSVAYYTPQDSPQVPQNHSPPMHHREFSGQSQTSTGWYQDSPAPTGTNWAPVPVYQTGPTQPAGPAPMQRPQTYYPPPPVQQQEAQDQRAELPAMRTPVPLDGMMLQQQQPKEEYNRH